MGQDEDRPDIGRVDAEANQGNEWAEFVASRFDPAKAAPPAIGGAGRKFIRGAGGVLIPVVRVSSPRQVRAHRMMRQPK